ncbi:restriction endonuclease [Leuconostocaceae bacterium ESL0723]|nr:restriction endonuclease [Leuconostocaceae bacterium ESL0723]
MSSEYAKTYDQMTVQEREDAIMMALLEVLQSVGGKLDKKEARNQLPKTDPRISEDVLWFEKASDKTGITYRPFDFRFNFAARRLELFGCVESVRGKFFILTDKGLSLDLKKITPEYIREVTDRDLEELKAQKAKKEQTEKIVENPKQDEIADGDTETDDYVSDDDDWREQLKIRLREMDPYQFEKFSRRLIKEMGATIDDEIGMQKSGDHGIDGYAYFRDDQLRTTRVAIQSKRYNQQVGDKYVRDFRGSIQNGTDYGILITTDYFTKAAKKEAKDPSKSTPITLLDLDDVIDLVEKYQLFIKKIETYELGSFYFE